MSTNGVLPFETDFGLEPDLVPAVAETAELPTDVPRPLGVDLGFDPVMADMAGTRDGDMILLDEDAALRQWIDCALQTQVTVDAVYSPAFGSELMAIASAGLPRGAYEEQIANAVRDAVLAHDRIDSVDDVRVKIPGLIDEPLFFTGSVTLDDSEQLQFEAGGL